MMKILDLPLQSYGHVQYLKYPILQSYGRVLYQKHPNDLHLRRQICAAKKKPFKKKPPVKDGDKNARFTDCDNFTQQELLKSRRQEWGKRNKYGAGHILTKKEMDESLAVGADCLPMQWVETDKAAHQRRVGGPYLKLIFKSRLVACGNHADVNVRSDSPTSDPEAHNLIASWAASVGVLLQAGHVENAYFKGERMDRLVTFRPPRGGIPGAEIEPDGGIAARVPVYGQSDSGRRFWLTVKQVFAAAGVTMNQILPAVFSISKDGTIQGWLPT